MNTQVSTESTDTQKQYDKLMELCTDYAYHGKQETLPEIVQLFNELSEARRNETLEVAEWELPSKIVAGTIRSTKFA